MFSLITLIMFFFMLLATILIVVMVAIAIAVLLILATLVSMFVGVQKNSFLRGLRVFLISISVIISGCFFSITTSFVWTQYFPPNRDLSLVVGGIVGCIVGALLGYYGYNGFYKLAMYVQRRLDRKTK